jgi:hypothetical protein
MALGAENLVTALDSKSRKGNEPAICEKMRCRLA